METLLDDADEQNELDGETARGSRPKRTTHGGLAGGES